MKRCSKCLLPDTLPNSNFNSQDECFWCQTGYPLYEPKGNARLKRILESHRSQTNTADCLVGLSGGKDSTYTLYRLVKEYGLKVEAFTYIHEGSVDFALENAKNVCKQLGVKHHIVSLKNQAHLKSFQDYFIAWTEQETAVSAGLTCVACKHLHILGYQIAVKRKIPMIVWSSSPLEYSPFLAIKNKQDKKNPFKREGLIKSSYQFIKQAIKSPKLCKAFINNFHTSVYGCLAVFPSSSYLSKRFPTIKSIMFYDYETWDPQKIRAEIQEQLNWKVPAEIKEDWHSDCVFNIFKEYMFQKMLGVSYTDAFLSNQIRYGLKNRESALIELQNSKKNFSEALPRALAFVKLDYLASKIDFDCFKEKE